MKQYQLLLPTGLAVILLVVMSLPHWSRHRAIVLPDPFKLDGYRPSDAVIEQRLLEDMRQVAYIVGSTWEQIGYPLPFEELKLIIDQRMRIPFYDVNPINNLRAFGLYYKVSFDGQWVQLEAYNMNGRFIGRVTGSRYCYYSHRPGTLVSV